MNLLLKNKGLTLIEVLIALAIISIAFTAIVLSTSQTIRNTAYLQNKMIASWVGIKIINEIRAGIIKPESGETLRQTEYLGKKLFWKAITSSTPNPKIQKVEVQISTTENEKSMINWITYVYQN